MVRQALTAGSLGGLLYLNAQAVGECHANSTSLVKQLRLRISVKRLILSSVWPAAA